MVVLAELRFGTDTHGPEHLYNSKVKYAVVGYTEDSIVAMSRLQLQLGLCCRILPKQRLTSRLLNGAAYFMLLLRLRHKHEMPLECNTASVLIVQTAAYHMPRSILQVS